MTEFEDNLWLAVVREHGDELARAERTVHRRRRVTRAGLLAGTTAGAATIATAVALLLGASTSPPAFAVTRNPDGTVTVDLMKPAGIPGANHKLAVMGVRAHIVAMAKLAPKLVCPGGTAPTITFDPASVPSRWMLMITPGQPGTDGAAAPKTNPSSGNTTIGTTGRAALPNPGAGAISSDGNHVVQLYPGSGKIRTDSGVGNHVVRMYCP